MTLENILMDIQANVDRSNEPIDWSDEDTIVRIAIINRGIRRWADDNVTRWDELYSNNIAGTIGMGTTSLPLDDEFALLDAVYDENGVALEIKNIRDATTVGRYFYVSGNSSDGYQLNLGWIPTEDDPMIGKQIRVMTYRQSIMLEKPSDTPEMRNPYYLVAYTSAELMIDDDTTQYGKYENDAALALANMRDVNDQMAQRQRRNALDDDSESWG